MQAPTKEERRKRETKKDIIDLRFDRGQVVGFRKDGNKTFHKLHVIGMNDDLWDKSLWIRQ